MDREAIDNAERAVRAFMRDLPATHQILAKAQITVIREHMRAAYDAGSFTDFMAGNWLSQFRALAEIANTELQKNPEALRNPTMSSIQAAMMTAMVFALAVCDEFPSTPPQVPKQQAN